MNPFVFLVGSSRSGTTLLKRLVNAHPQIAITPETHWITRFFEAKKGITAEGTVTAELVSALVDYYRFPRMNIDPQELSKLINASEPISYSKFVSAVFDLYGRAHSKSFVGDKTGQYLRSIDVLHLLWPSAKFVHLIRDGRDVCLSLTQWKKRASKFRKRFQTWNDDPVATAACLWEWRVRLGREAGASIGKELYYEIRYEALVANPKDECMKLCAFLDLPYDDAMLRFHEGRTRTEPGLNAKTAWLPVTPGLRDWRKEMSPMDIRRFEAVAGDLLSELGYTRGCPNVPSELLQYGSQIREVFSNKPGKAIPQRW